MTPSPVHQRRAFLCLPARSLCPKDDKDSASAQAVNW